MYVQFSEGFPGIAIQDEQIYADRSQDLSQPLEKLYSAYLEHKLEQYAISPAYAAGLHAFLSQQWKTPFAVKGQITGPVSFGLAITDEGRRPIIYDEVLADALAKHLRLKAAWQEKVLHTVSTNTIIFIDEPYLASIGSAFVSLPWERAAALLEEVLGGVQGLRGIHCCGNTDWSLLLQAPFDILSFDAYNYGRSLNLYPAEVKSFLERGGVIAWGIVPNDERALEVETVSSLSQRLDTTMGLLCHKGIDYDMLREQSLLTPSCGLGLLSVEGAAKALELLAGLSKNLRGEIE
jgi:methionine synthase II (cobalamin-independent)